MFESAWGLGVVEVVAGGVLAGEADELGEVADLAGFQKVEDLGSDDFWPGGAVVGEVGDIGAIGGEGAELDALRHSEAMGVEFEAVGIDGAEARDRVEIGAGNGGAEDFVVDNDLLEAAAAAFSARLFGVACGVLGWLRGCVWG